MKINSKKVIGTIKPMHAVNNIPVFYPKEWGDHPVNELFFDMSIPMVRFHDTAYLYPYHKMVDVPCIFPDFDADENNHASYDFTFTDRILEMVATKGVKIFYRLGVSIENYGWIKPYDIHPPKDALKWAKICEHIIAHYNEGWADGFHYNIEYWEIWNEPESHKMMFTGTFEDYLNLYVVTANLLKKRFPYIKIGGYASCGLYAAVGRNASGAANVSEQQEYFVEFFHDFLKRISTKQESAPLDFFSWHSYSAVSDNVLFAEYVRKTLDSYGFTQTESILNEWNPQGIYIRGTLKAASDVLANMIVLQNKPVDMLMYYDARLSTSYCGLFNPIGDIPRTDLAKPFPLYYVFKAFSEVYKMGNQVEVQIEGENVFAIASANDGKTVVLLTNNKDEREELDLNSLGNVEKICSITDINKLDEVVSQGGHYTLQAYETLLIYLN